MRLHGWCERCRRIRYVSVTGAGLAALAAGGVPTGVCADCEAKQKARAAR